MWLPAGATGPKYLIFNNFKVFKRYNNADSYALAVGLSGDAFTGKKVPVAVWPTDIEPLTVAEIKILQASLNSRGFDAGVVDGIPGRKTRTALQGFQKSQGVVADGYPDQGHAGPADRRICSRCLDQLIRGPFPDRTRPRRRAGRNRRKRP
jgi:membrane-bound lytic murein transglycosylase B